MNLTDSSGPIIALLTDFGSDAHYVAQMKGVIYGLRPQTLIVDVTHSIAPQDTCEAAWVLADVEDAFAAGTIFVVVVDPGVGSARPLVAVHSHRHFFIGPDNGVFSLSSAAATDCEVIMLDRPEYWRSRISATFHGRDIMAPVAAHLANGTSWEKLGSPARLTVVQQFPPAALDVVGRRTVGRVEYTDSFGNLITNIRREDLPPPADHGLLVTCASRSAIPVVHCYADRPHRSVVALIGSSGRLEIAVVGGNAQSELQVARHAPVLCFPQ